jgi:hypothetical protein
MRANDVQSPEAIRHGAYLCLSVPPNARREVARIAVPALAQRLGLQNEFDSTGGDPPESIGFLRREDATSADVTDDELLHADAVVHVASATAEPVAEFCAELARLVDPAIKPRVLGGVVRPMTYTSSAMFNFAYAHRVVQQPGTVMPHAFLVPMSKTSEWWEKDWMERHTYFLPRYDDAGRMLNEGHALAAATGIDCLMRRTYKHATDPAPEGAYEFVSYFECASEDVATFYEVCAALRDVTRNPEWKFVREGPTWHGRRVATWTELFD